MKKYSELWDEFEPIYKMFEKKYTFRFCQVNEISKLIDFIDNYWQKGHVFTKSRVLLDWQHFDNVNNRYNFVLAIDKATDEIHGIIGFILSSIYDSNIKSPIRWGAIWKVRDNVAPKGLGIALKYYFEKNAPAHYVGGIGLSKYSKAINSKLGETTGILKPFYMLNRNMEMYYLLDNFSGKNFPNVSSNENISFKEIDGTRFAELSRKYFNEIPEFKSALYYVNRYAKHPVYNYTFYELYNGSNAIACIITRNCTFDNHASLAIVDYIGPSTALKGSYNAFQTILNKEQAEYISFYQYGLDDIYLFNAGFLKRHENESIIIPIYYEPFFKGNIDLDFHFYSDKVGSTPLMFKGDADQDRPNKL